jgi:hypothetical protein
MGKGIGKGLVETLPSLNAYESRPLLTENIRPVRITTYLVARLGRLNTAGHAGHDRSTDAFFLALCGPPLGGTETPVERLCLLLVVLRWLGT